VLGLRGVELSSPPTDADSREERKWLAGSYWFEERANQEKDSLPLLLVKVSLALNFPRRALSVVTHGPRAVKKTRELIS